MHNKAEIAAQAVKASAAGGTLTTVLAWFGTNSDAIVAMCALGTFTVVTITAIINWWYKMKASK